MSCKIFVQDQISLNNGLDEGVTIEELAIILNRLQKELQIVDPIKLKMEYYYDSAELVACFSRLETDAEYSVRIKKEQLKEQKRIEKEEKERKEYERLKAKFEK